MTFNEKEAKVLNLLSTELLPNRYHLEFPFELIHLRLLDEDPSTLSIFLANTGGSYYTNMFLNDLPFPNSALSGGELHTHDYYEFMFVIDGGIYQNIDCLRHYYPCGGGCIVGPEIPHSEEYNESASMRLLFFKLRKDYVTSLLRLSCFFDTENTETCRRCDDFFSSDEGYLDFIPQKDHAWQVEQVHSLFEKITNLLISPGETASLEISLLIYKILILLFDRSLYDNTPVPPGTEDERHLFLDIRRYMENRPSKCTRADLTDYFHFSGDYLYKVVKNHSGLTIHDLSIRICMKKAANLLRSTDMNINEIADHLGFHNYTQFYAVFRKYYSVTPRQYRQLNIHAVLTQN